MPIPNRFEIDEFSDFSAPETKSFELIYQALVEYQQKIGGEVQFSYSVNELSYNWRVNSIKDRIFDLASVTKVLSTTRCFMDFVEQGRLNLTDSIKSVFPELNKSDLGARSWDQLLSHTAGLKNWYPLYLEVDKDDSQSLINIIQSFELLDAGNRVYSDFGYILLGLAIERLKQQPLSSVFAALVQNYGIENHLLGDRPPIQQCVPTSWGNPFEKDWAEKLGCDVSRFNRWRNFQVIGQANDGNCFYLKNGLMGHCGLFGSLEGVSLYLKKWMQDPSLSQQTWKQFLPSTAHPQGLGFVTGEKFLQLQIPNETKKKTSKLGAPLVGVGHHGFTGCSVAFDLETQSSLVFLSNRQFKGELPYLDRKEILLKLTGLLQNQ